MTSDINDPITEVMSRSILSNCSFELYLLLRQSLVCYKWQCYSQDYQKLTFDLVVGNEDNHKIVELESDMRSNWKLHLV